MKYITGLIIALFLISSTLVAGETRLQAYDGGEIVQPYWFKESFLELADDLNEAEEEGKHLLLYFHQAGCPYCYNFVQQSLLDPALTEYIQDNFDLVALDLWGDREVILPDEQAITEKELAKHWKIQYTPTLIFFKGSLANSLRIDGYRSKQMFVKILDHVASGDQNISLAESLLTTSAGAKLYPAPDFLSADKLKLASNKKPKLVLFEYPGCEDCIQLHRDVLTRSDTHKLLQRFDLFRVDVSQDKTIEIKDGQTITAKQWAEQLGLSFYPSTLLLGADSNELFRVDTYAQSFHYQAALEYVSEKIYLRLPEFQRYINERGDRLRAAGQKVEITR